MESEICKIFTIQNQPESLSFLRLHSLPPEGREDPVRPVVGGGVRLAEHLAVRDGLRVEPHLPVGGPVHGEGGRQGLDAGGLAGATGPEDHDAVP